VRRFIRVPCDEVYSSLVYFLEKDLNMGYVDREEETMIITTRLGKIRAIGLVTQVRVFAENEASTVELGFSYRSFFMAALAVLIAVIVASIAMFSIMPFLGLIIPVLLLFDLGKASGTFLNSVNDFLSVLERNREKTLLAESRRRWQADPRKTNEIYNKLLEKHVKTWGDGHVLEYKVSEYMKTGLTHEESIRRIAEEEGIF